MSDLQKRFYDGADRIKSDPLGWFDRDNRNHRKKQQLVLDRVRAERGDMVLEVGCGHGLHARRYDRLFNYAGVDISESLVDATRKRTGSTACVKQADATDLPMPNNYFQAVVGNAILHHIPDPGAALREWCRVVKPGGSVTITEPNYLFPKDLLETHFRKEERHKKNMAPWRLRRLLQRLPYEYEVQPFLFTLPWPEQLHGVYDRIDGVLSRVPGVRWTAQMLLIHIEVDY